MFLGVVWCCLVLLGVAWRSLLRLVAVFWHSDPVPQPTGKVASLRQYNDNWGSIKTESVMLLWSPDSVFYRGGLEGIASNYSWIYSLIIVQSNLKLPHYPPFRAVKCVGDWHHKFFLANCWYCEIFNWTLFFSNIIHVYFFLFLLSVSSKHRLCTE